MGYDPQKHHRRSIRLKGFDYSQNAVYFITLVTQGRACLFGEITHDIMQPNAAAKIIEKAWLELVTRFPNIQLDEFMVMPNHFHAIICVGTGKITAPPKSLLGDIVGAYKSITTHEYILSVRRGELPHFSGRIWQRNYYEHIVRDESEWERIRLYIQNNPTLWLEDRENPDLELKN